MPGGVALLGVRLPPLPGVFSAERTAIALLPLFLLPVVGVLALGEQKGDFLSAGICYDLSVDLGLI
tara:strand:- start:123 stop:320 length:198 start_codon:yes stop_codon:yes gene_type:complete